MHYSPQIWHHTRAQPTIAHVAKSSETTAIHSCVYIASRRPSRAASRRRLQRGVRGSGKRTDAPAGRPEKTAGDIYPPPCAPPAHRGPTRAQRHTARRRGQPHGGGNALRGKKRGWGGLSISKCFKSLRCQSRISYGNTGPDALKSIPPLYFWEKTHGRKHLSVCGLLYICCFTQARALLRAHDACV